MCHKKREHNETDSYQSLFLEGNIFYLYKYTSLDAL